jgi:taurine dioxygenase
MSNSTIDIRPASAATGAEIHGVDLREPMTDRIYREIRNALNEYGVIFFRDQDLTPGQHVAFTERFGKILVTDFMNPVAGHPMITIIGKEPEQTRNIGGNWHTDHSFEERPPLGSVLVARELPSVGGDTMFASMYDAYDRLSEGLRQTLEGMRAVHSKRSAFDPKKLTAERQSGTAKEIAELEGRTKQYEAVHPVCPRHPESGRKLLYVNPNYTSHFDGWTVEESEPLLQYLYRHATRPESTCRFHWQPGSIAFWDNRSTWHLALNDYHGMRRIMHRITIDGAGFADA